MKTYKRSLFELVKGIVIGLVTGIAAHIVLGLFFRNVILVTGVPILIAAAILYITFFSEDIYFELEPEGVFRYYKRRILQNTFNLKNCYIWYHRKSESGFPPTHDITLKMLDSGAEDGEIQIDCSPLGLARFDEMYNEMEEFALKDKTVLSAATPGPEKEDKANGSTTSP
ncbi:MAG: hypothetical protein LBH26_01005 [Treponema sp.]|nr:hypothetical protein [Treponema sp.]